MQRAAGMFFLLSSTLVSAYAFQALSHLIGVGGNAVRHYRDNLIWDSGCLLFAVLLTIAFLFTARGPWRFAALLPLVICAFVASAIVVAWSYAFA
jgi:hypothetical protein